METSLIGAPWVNKMFYTKFLSYTYVFRWRWKDDYTIDFLPNSQQQYQFINWASIHTREGFLKINPSFCQKL